ncbi:Calcineurin-binding protein cabin-1, partial [Nowakowskiella sp. JEL0078]
MKFAVLNEATEEEITDAVTSLEIELELALKKYNLALIHHSKGFLELAASMYQELLSEWEEILKDMNTACPVDNNIQASPVHALIYLSHKNLANILEKTDKADSAIDHYLKSLELDSSDPLVWFRFGELCIQKSDLSVAKNAFENGFKIAPSRSLKWSCLTSLINCLYNLGEFDVCLSFVIKALEENPTYGRGLWIKQEILKELPEEEIILLWPEQSSFERKKNKEKENFLIQKLLENDSSICQPRNPAIVWEPPRRDIITFYLESLSWQSLGSLLLTIFEKFKQEVSFTHNVKIELELNDYKVPKSMEASELPETQQNLETQTYNQPLTSFESESPPSKRKRRIFDHESIRTSKRKKYEPDNTIVNLRSDLEDAYITHGFFPEDTESIEGWTHSEVDTFFELFRSRLEALKQANSLSPALQTSVRVGGCESSGIVDFEVEKFCGVEGSICDFMVDFADFFVKTLASEPDFTS